MAIRTDQDRAKMLKMLLDKHMDDQDNMGKMPVEDATGRQEQVNDPIRGEDPDGNAEDDGMGSYPADPRMNQASVRRPMPRMPNDVNPRGGANVNLAKPPENEAEDDTEMDEDPSYQKTDTRGGEEMVSVPKRMVDTVMAQMMQQASGGRSQGADGSDMPMRKPKRA